MPALTVAAKELLRSFELRRLFINELGWDRYVFPSKELQCNGVYYPSQGIAEKRGVAAIEVDVSATGMPGRETRILIDKLVSTLVREHIVAYVDKGRKLQIWQWAKREPGQPVRYREHVMQRQQSGEALAQKLEQLAISIEEEDDLVVSTVARRARRAFDVERVTKRFYERFRDEHAKLAKQITGIPTAEEKAVYASLILNRLMFVYFVQKKGFLNDDATYLQNLLAKSRAKAKDDFFIQYLCPLFFDAFSLPLEARPPAARKLGTVPYLNGGLFVRHNLEHAYLKSIAIPDRAFDGVLAFFEQYQWHLDDRPVANDNEINPDVLGFIFEKYINQKQMGAYYTKPDITEYITASSLIPSLLQLTIAGGFGAVATEMHGLLAAMPDRYLWEHARHGLERELPARIARGVKDAAERGSWSETAFPEFGNPGESWREAVARRAHTQAVRERLLQKPTLSDLVACNVDLRQLFEDLLRGTTDPAVVATIYSLLTGHDFPGLAARKQAFSVLDPTCGSGAFLFAALSILETVYETCLERMQDFVESKHRDYAAPFSSILATARRHSNLRYFILKSIIVNNIYGVDVMDEAVGIAKLRLFLKLMSQITSVSEIEPLPDIDFNISCGNSLVGFSTEDDVRAAFATELAFHGSIDDLMRKARSAGEHYARYREYQVTNDAQFLPEKRAMGDLLADIDSELNKTLASQYGVSIGRADRLSAWVASHQPFHWFVHFFAVHQAGGFDVIIGNPPYVEYRKVEEHYKVLPGKYASYDVKNLYAYCMERACSLIAQHGWFGMIVPSAVLGLKESRPLRDVLLARFQANVCSTYAIRPSKLFDVDQRLCIYLGSVSNPGRDDIATSTFNHWTTEERPFLFQTLAIERSFRYPTLNRIAQVGSYEALSVLTKLIAHGHKTVGTSTTRLNPKSILFYHRSPRYWIRAQDAEPYFKSDTRERSIHHIRELKFEKVQTARAIGALLNSSLFFFWFLSIGNGRNLTDEDVTVFPTGDMSDETAKALAGIFQRLMKDYEKNSFIRVRRDCEFQEFRVSKSKPLLDEIDQVLGKHFGFTDSEIDFIQTFDMKYRLGAPDDEEEE